MIVCWGCFVVLCVTAEQYRSCTTSQHSAGASCWKAARIVLHCWLNWTNSYNV